MAERAATLTDADRLDAVIVDEAQDVANDWWTPLVRALRDDSAGGCSPRFGRPPLALIPLVVDRNLRNTGQISQSILPLAPASMVLRGGDGPEVEFIPTSQDEVMDAADDAVERLLDEGWQPQDVALLTMGARHPVQRECQETPGFAAYWEEFWSNDDVFYGHVLGFKGMERRAVVLCLNEDGTRDRSRERLYVALSRATDRLVVVGDSRVLERIGGRQVLDYLRRS